MKRKIVQTGSSLAVTLPAEVVETFNLKKGQEEGVDVHPSTGAVVVWPGVKYFERVTVATARGEMSAEALALWFRQRSRAVEP